MAMVRKWHERRAEAVGQDPVAAATTANTSKPARRAVNEALHSLGCEVRLRWKTEKITLPSGTCQNRHKLDRGRFRLGQSEGEIRERRGQNGIMFCIHHGLRRRAMAVPPRVAPIAAGARIQRGDEHEIGRKRRAVKRPGDRHRAVFQRLAQHFERLAVELGQLVEEQHAVVGQA